MEMHNEQQLFKLLSVLFQYPSEEWIFDKDIEFVIANIQDKEIKQQLTTFIEYLRTTPSDELGNTYVNTFDFNATTTLYLTYVLFKDSRERGQALLKLKGEFHAAGVQLLTDELPDYFPLLLEFAAIAKPEFAVKLFKVNHKAVTLLQQNLKEIDSPYCSLLNACHYTIKDFIDKKQAS